MTKKIHAVLGANYGDEGKGRTTDYLAGKHHGDKRAVVRFNGGAQAGHTVCSGGYRHVFSHFGSASFDYVPTIFTSDFVCSPYLFKKENEQLIRKGVIRPDLYVSPNCPVTTPWDMWFNQMVEQKRGNGRHGSVGVGFGETLERHNNPEFRLTVGDILNPITRNEKIVKIVTKYLPARMAQLDLKPWEMDEHFEWIYRNPDQILDIFEMECAYFISRISVMEEDEAFDKFDTLIFEGAQGLALDQQSPDFPHVTRSFTGIDNVLRALNFAGIDDPINLTYVTRPYLTRHGAGPLKGEMSDAESFSKWFNVVDETNKPHEYQGSLRFAMLDIDDAIDRIIKDQFKIPRKQIGQISLMTTCFDQIVDEDGFPAVLNGKSYMFSPRVFSAEFGSRINAEKVILCHGEEDFLITEGKIISQRDFEETYGD